MLFSTLVVETGLNATSIQYAARDAPILCANQNKFELCVFIYLFNLFNFYTYPPDLQESDGGANT